MNVGCALLAPKYSQCGCVRTAIKSLRCRVLAAALLMVDGCASQMLQPQRKRMSELCTALSRYDRLFIPEHPSGVAQSSLDAQMMDDRAGV
jgi:hypothetical protein